MIKNKTITVKPVKGYTREIEVYFCDICGKESKGGLYKCVVCRRGICRICRVLDPECWGDYPDSYCPICSKLKFTTYKTEREEEEQRHDEAEEAIFQKIKKESLATKS